MLNFDNLSFLIMLVFSIFISESVLFFLSFKYPPILGFYFLFIILKMFFFIDIYIEFINPIKFFLANISLSLMSIKDEYVG